MLLMSCRLQELEIYFGRRTMKKVVSLERIGSLHELTSLHLIGGLGFIAEGLTEFIHRPSMASIVSLNLTGCYNLDDKVLEGIAERCNKLKNLHV